MKFEEWLKKCFEEKVQVSRFDRDVDDFFIYVNHLTNLKRSHFYFRYKNNNDLDFGC